MGQKDMRPKNNILMTANSFDYSLYKTIIY